MQIRFCFYPPVYQFKVGVCAGVSVGGIGVGGGGGALKNLNEMVGGVLKYSFVFKGGPRFFLR